MSHLMADGIRVCGKPDGHPGKHYAVATVQREADRMLRRRTTPGPCTMKGCTSDRYQYMTWEPSYDVRCWIHANLHASSKRLRRLREELVRMGGTPWTRDEVVQLLTAFSMAFPSTPTS